MRTWRDIYAIILGDSTRVPRRISKGRFRVVAGRYANSRTSKGPYRRAMEGQHRRFPRCD